MHIKTHTTAASASDFSKDITMIMTMITEHTAHIQCAQSIQ